MTLPQSFTPEQVAAHFGWSPRKLREIARSIGACTVIGNKMTLTEIHVNEILEANRWRSSSPSEAATGKSRAPSKGSGVAKALALLKEIEQQRNAS